MDDVTLDLRRLGSVFWMRRAIIAVAIVAVVAGALAVSLTRAPVYRAHARVVARPVLPPPLYDREADVTSNLSPLTHAHIVASPVIARRVIGSLGLSADPDTLASSVAVTVLTEDVFEITAVAGDGTTAASIANAFGSEYLSYTRETTISGYERAADTLRTKLASAEAQAAEVDRALDTATTDAHARRLLNQSERLALRADGLRARLEDAVVAIASATEGGEIVKPAVVASAPSSPRPVRDGAIAVIVGLIFGMGAAVLRQSIDDRIRSRADATRAAGVPVVAGVPRIRSWSVRGAAYLATVGEPGSEAAEAYRGLRQSLIAMGLGASSKTILVTSGGPRAGKTSTAANLGVTCAQAGLRVVLVSGDLRNPQLHEYLSVANGTGLSEVLRDGASSVDALTDTSIPGLQILVAGQAMLTPASLVDRKHLDMAIADLRAHADVVIIDAPPLSAGADTAVFAPRADLTLLVIRQAMARARGTSRAVADLRAAGAGRIAVVLNMADEQAARDYGEAMIVLDTVPTPPPVEERPIAAPPKKRQARSPSKR